MITIFTPTYNRAYRITNLYESLCIQSNKNFEWIIVDDGSIDNTKELVQSFIIEKKINITYFYQKNQGKHIAINKGVEFAKGEYFFIVDSDDMLPNNSIELINVYTNKLFKDNIAGIVGRKSYFNGELVGSNKEFKEIISNSIDIRYKENIKGDLAEVFKTNVIKKFPFPTYNNEKFCPEALIWNRISSNYNLLYFNQSIYNCEYLNDGLTANIIKVRKKSPQASMIYYSELEKYDIPFLQKIKANINFWRFSFNSEDSFKEKLNKISILNSILGILLGYIMYLKDKNI